MPPGNPLSQELTPPPGFAEIAQSLRDDKPPQTTVDVLKKQASPSGFMTITKSLREDKSPQITVGIPQETTALSLMVGSAMTTITTTWIC